MVCGGWGRQRPHLPGDAPQLIEYGAFKSHDLWKKPRSLAKLSFFLPQGSAIIPPMIHGYARVSTDGQSVDAQVKQLRDAGAENIFRETASGAKTDRRELARALREIGEGDILLVTRLDRLARSTRDLLNSLAKITERGATFKSLADTWADTTTAHGRLMLTVLGGLAEFERELIRARTGEGRARAKARGQSLGRPFKLTPHQRQEAVRRRDAGEETLTEIGRSYNVSAQTISRLSA